MRRLPLLSAVVFGLAALLFSLVLLLPDRNALPLRGSGLLILLAVLPALLWGYMGGRYLRPEAHEANRAHFGLVGAVVTVVASVTGALVLAGVFVYASATSHPESALATVEAVLAVLGYGLAFGFIAMPFGIGAGLILRTLARRLQPPAV